MEQKKEEKFTVKIDELIIYFMNNRNRMPSPRGLLVLVGGLVGISSQAAVKAKGLPFFLVTANSKKYLFGDSLNYYLIESKNSFINLLKAKCKELLPNLEFPDIEKIVKNVSANVGNDDYKLENKYNPELFFPKYMMEWSNMFDIVNKSCSSPEGWPVLLTYVLNFFIEVYIKNDSENTFSSLLPIIIENAFYISKILQ